MMNGTRFAILAMLTLFCFSFYTSLWTYLYHRIQIYFLSYICGSIKQISKNTTNLSNIIVISRWNEDITWVDVCLDNMNHIIYTKEDKLASHNVPGNKAHEATSYLRYILDYYDTLPEIVVFMHAHRRAWHQKEPDNIVKGLKSFQWGKYDFMPLQTKFMTNSEFRKNHSSKQVAFNYQLWTDVLSELGPPPQVVVTYCCASFAVKRHVILRRSKVFYEKIYKYLQTKNESDYISGRAMEYTWHIIFGQPYIIQQFSMCDLFYCKDYKSM